MSHDPRLAADGLRDYLRRYPRHATFGGAWSGPTALVELDAALELARELRADGLRYLGSIVKRPERPRQTPPDCLARSQTGGLIGIEVTQLANHELVRENIIRQRKWTGHVCVRSAEGVPSFKSGSPVVPVGDRAIKKAGRSARRISPDYVRVGHTPSAL